MRIRRRLASMLSPPQYSLGDESEWVSPHILELKRAGKPLPWEPGYEPPAAEQAEEGEPPSG